MERTATDGTTAFRHRRLEVFNEPPHPAYVVWELTLRCDQGCRHCGSRAGVARPAELSVAEVVDVAQQLADLGAREVVLIGGEAYLHEGLSPVVRTLSEAEVVCSLVTGGLGITQDLAAAMAAAGMKTASVSVDGLAETHDLIRVPGSFVGATQALGRLKNAGMGTGVNTNLNRLNRHDLEGIYGHLRDQGVSGWQVQITVPLGRAADRPDMMLQPWDLIELLPRIAALKRRAFDDSVLVMPGNNLGYFGPEEALLRSLTVDGRDHFCGCFAGRLVLGIQSDGAIKGCLSLPGDSYIGGNVREQPLAEIWDQSAKLGFTRRLTVDQLWGFCRECPFGETCLGGCSFAAHAVLGRPGNNPFCHYRARHFDQLGQRERLVLQSPASGAPMDHGLYRIVLEPRDAPDPRARRDRAAALNRPG
ncbi:MAG: heme biosynthesis protein [Deltaproteobacteria bacterium]|nr:MAG: heme biosynthesis protein [Deltaproteobacteria bacterium]